MVLHSLSLHHALRAHAAACTVRTGHSSHRQTLSALGVVACDTSSYEATTLNVRLKCLASHSLSLTVHHAFRTTHHARANARANAAAAACTVLTVLSSLPPSTLGNETHSLRRQTPNNLGVAARLFPNLV